MNVPTILLLDEVPFLREGLASLLREECPDLAFIETDYAAPRVPVRPDLIVANIRSRTIASGWLAEQTKNFPDLCQGAPILLISELDVSQEGRQAIEAGYAGFLPSTQSGTQLAAAIRVILAGGRFYLRLDGGGSSTSN